MVSSPKKKPSSQSITGRLGPRQYIFLRCEPSRYTLTCPVTGANRGIGLGIAESCLVNYAARVYSLDIGDTTDNFHALSQRFPDRLFAIHTDEMQESSIATAVDKIIAEAGALHGMVANALEFTDEEIEALFSVNVGPYHPAVLIQVLIGSYSGHFIQPGRLRGPSSG